MRARERVERRGGNPYFFVQRGLPFLSALHSRVAPFESCAVEPTAALEQNCPARGSLAGLVLAMAGETRRARARAAAMRRMRTSNVEEGRDRAAQHYTRNEQIPVYGFVMRCATS